MSDAPDPSSLAELVWTHRPTDERHNLRDWTQAGALCFDLRRRSVDHGVLIVGDRPPSPTGDPPSAFRHTKPVFLPDVLTERLADCAPHIARTLDSFEAFRHGARLLDDLDERLSDQDVLEYSSSTVDLSEPREIEKVFVDARDPEHPVRRRVARDLSAKLSWISLDASDESLRIRFSFGHESTGDWLEGGERAFWSDRFCEAAFPERSAITDCPDIRNLLDQCLDRPWRLSETIVYSNAPGGGAVFHHDADEGQRGVLFIQCSGVTVWLAVPNEALATAAGVHPTELEACLQDSSDPLRSRLDQDPEFTAKLAAEGHLFALGPGDALLLPSHGPESCCWHSVFGTTRVGEADGPSLGLSFAIFDAD
ncbi:MAG: hypothetical protein AAF196_03175 [Planctomycetota bacterium]